MLKLKKNKFLSLIVIAMLLSMFSAVLPAAAAPLPVPLGTAANFAVLAGSTVTSTGNSVINGNLGLSPGSSVTGFPPGKITGTEDIDNAAAVAAKANLTTAYNDAVAETGATPIAGNIGGKTLTPGVYKSTSTLSIIGTLTLSGAGVYIFQMGTALTTAADSSVLLTGGALASNVFWQVGSSATLGAGSSFSGTILAFTSITADSGVTVNGQLLAINGAVTLIDDAVTAPVQTQTQTATPVIATPIYAGTTSVSGTSADNAIISLTVNGGTAHTTTASSSGAWTVTGLTLVVGNTISVTATAPGDTVSPAATATVVAPVQTQTATPVITTPIHAGATSVSGTSADNASISLTVSGTVYTATASSSGAWTVSGLTLVVGETISVTAQVTGETVSQPATATVVAACQGPGYGKGQCPGQGSGYGKGQCPGQGSGYGKGQCPGQGSGYGKGQGCNQGQGQGCNQGQGQGQGQNSGCNQGQGQGSGCDQR